MIRLVSLATNDMDNVTKVRIEIFESLGTMLKLKDTLELILKGIHQHGEELDEAIGQELQRNNYEYYKWQNQ